jgi:hypothetical protein
MREGDSREEDKEEGRGLGRGSSFWENSGRRRKGKGGDCKEKFLWGFLLGHCCCWDFGLGGQEI